MSEDKCIMIEVKYPAKSLHQKWVESFMVGANQTVPAEIIVPSKEVRELRARLIMEEALETIAALGFRVCQDYDEEDSFLRPDNITFFPELEPDLVEIADGCADIAVVTTGTLSACGIPDKELQELVDNNNLAKLGPGHSFNIFGKLIKPAGHKPPDIAKLLERLINEQNKSSNTKV